VRGDQKHAQLPQTILVIAMRRSRRVAAARAAQGQAAPVDSHFGQLPIELQERIIEIVVRCGVVLWPSTGMLPTLLFAVLAAGNVVGTSDANTRWHGVSAECAGCADFGMFCASAMHPFVSKAAHEASAEEQSDGAYGAARLPRLRN
jgi:hypothetical protein